MRPITFEAAKDAVVWEMIEQRAIAICRVLKASRIQQKAAVHARWKQHWRTRLSYTLHSLANKIEMPEPPRPE